MNNFRVHVTTFRGIPKARILERLGNSCQCEPDNIDDALVTFTEIVNLMKAVPANPRYPFVGVVMITDTVNGVSMHTTVV